VRTNSAPIDSIEAIAMLEEPNRRRLYDLVSGSPTAVGRDEAAEALAMSRELAAFHLDRLTDAGLLATEYRRRNGRAGPGAGRPAKLYRRSSGEVSVSLPPRRYDRAAEAMAIALEKLGRRGKGAIEPVAHRQGLAEVARAREAGLDGPAQAPEDELVEVLRGAGYEPSADRSGEIVLRNCPYDALVAEHRELTCGMNVAWAEGVVEGVGAHMAVEFVPSPERCCVVFRPLPA
jgi:predicted ArsR family transcriptional regulator